MLDWILKNICTNEVDETILAVNHLAEILKERVGNKRSGIKIHYSLEPEPLGTGGPLKKVEDRLSNGTTFLTTNGDILAEVPLKEMLDLHKDEGALATVALHEVKDPRRFGVAEFDKEMRIKRFFEKPRTNKIMSRWINAGIYLMEPRILKYIPARKRVSLEKEVFPTLSKEGKLFGFKLKGSWYDVGTIETFSKANYKLIRNESKQEPLLHDSVDIEKGANLIPPLVIRENCKVCSSSIIGPNSAISQDSYIGKKSIVKNSIIFENVKIGQLTKIEESIIGGNVEIGDNVQIGRGCVISDYVTIRNNLKISKGVTIHPYKEIEDDVKRPGHIL